MDEKIETPEPEKTVRVRMLTEEKLGKVFDVPASKAKDLIARGMAEVWREPVMTTASLPIQTRGSSR